MEDAWKLWARRFPGRLSVNRLPAFGAGMGRECSWKPLAVAEEGTTSNCRHTARRGHSVRRSRSWNQRFGYAKAALAQLLPEAKSIGCPFVELTTNPENIAQRVIQANGEFWSSTSPSRAVRQKPGLRFRIGARVALLNLRAGHRTRRCVSARRWFYHPPRGPSAIPALAPQLKRWGAQATRASSQSQWRTIFPNCRQSSQALPPLPRAASTRCSALSDTASH